MPSGDRLHHVAARGCLIAGLLFASPSLGQSDEQIAPAPSAQTESQQGQAREPAAPAIAEQRQAGPGKYEPDCESPIDREESDLCQQWRMAEAAEQQAKWTRLQFFATSFEVTFLVLAVTFTAWAAVAASKAARAGDKAAEAAQRSVALAADTAKRQLRAYVTVVYSAKQKPERMDSPPSFYVTLRNAGNTPAYGLTSGMLIVLGDYPDDKSVYDLPLAPRQITLGPRDEKTLGGQWGQGLTAEQTNALSQRRLAFYLVGRIEYRDAFGEPRYTNFKYVDIPGAASGLTACAEGNDAN
jgi:hypothetical protein